jgi:hypothetical protein
MNYQFLMPKKKKYELTYPHSEIARIGAITSAIS